MECLGIKKTSLCASHSQCPIEIARLAQCDLNPFLVAEEPLSLFETHFSVWLFLNGERVPALSTEMRSFFLHKNKPRKKFPISKAPTESKIVTSKTKKKSRLFTYFQPHRMSRNREDVSECLAFAVPDRNREARSMRFLCLFLFAEEPSRGFEKHFSVRMFLNGERVPASSTEEYL
ncbi:hypothetical protein CEXT_118351 [Caerostris extrusa]|uniref:Uncharacterized protein n=1 Tax=Caerostris extrusa TaxID=172846 RepID=A0AAV4UFU3_CAEEX|nr:hypothetical protein CEXT_118351 [Caerostris extrusa]